ncbi:protein PAM71, chloroplastic-like isoform X2 [Selaginella moellendorffii]|uniref:protein PAM71, chloroplastic-like isoform X2 n=1 Tax=Selaginella moellendorffii TaxID=88036 RepID=UPI000D1CC316|nr:protein PAM71, chloroplastic-like isoform X2 [Selaginella moellendorffii]|eukprot:XP_024524893.1 protein PAM71, chloroplastic-like isoform X2 [Selaginella moellendorffii]
MPCSKCLASGTLWTHGEGLVAPWRRRLAAPSICKRQRASIRIVDQDVRLHSRVSDRMPPDLAGSIGFSSDFQPNRFPAFPGSDFTNVRQREEKISNLRRLILQVATVSGFFALQSLTQAWAGSSMADAQQSASFLGFLGSIDEIKSGFTLAFLLIFFSELGDKTFFIAAILASRRSNVAVFTGTFGALVAMTLISVVLGRAFHYIDGVLPFSLGSNEIPLDDLAAVALLIYFGVSTLLDASSMEGSKSQEEQQEAELAVAGVNGGGGSTSSVVISTFALVFVAEWGDKSFFSTIALAAASSPVGVVAGAIAGHGAATLLAVLGGSIMGNYISEKAIAYIGGTLFLVFAGETLFEILTGSK